MIRSYPYHSFGSHEDVLNDEYPFTVSSDACVVLCVAWVCNCAALCDGLLIDVAQQ